MSDGTRVASLPMYGEAEHRPAIERWWAGLARHLREAGVPGVPDTLTWPDDYHGHWRSPDLLLSQTCGYPFVNVLGPAVKLVATPRYDAPGCEGARYGAHVIVPEAAEAQSVADLRGCRLATNGTGSYSGYRVWRHMLPAGDDPPSFFGEIVTTGAHRASVRRVAAGEADACAVDCVTHALAFGLRAGGVARHPNPAVIANGAGHPVRDQCGDTGRGCREAARRTPRRLRGPVARARAQGRSASPA